MSRVIKFRAWNKQKNIMCYDNEDDSADYWDGVVSSEVGLINFRLGMDNKYEYMQYTGLKDRNGKEAYHKDIVDYEGFLYVIEWDEKNTGFYLAYIRDLDNPESEEHLKGSCITLSTIKSHALESGKLLQGEDTP